MKTILKRLLPTALLLGSSLVVLWHGRFTPAEREQAPVAPLPFGRSIAAERPREPFLSAEPALPMRDGQNAAFEAPPKIPAVPAAELSNDADKVREWARSEPAEAITWLLHAPPGETRDAVMEIVCAEVAQFDPAEAVALAERYCAGYIPLLENLVHQWAERDETAATAYAHAKPPGEMRNRLLGRVALVRAKADPASAAKFVVEQIEPGDIQSEAAIGVLHAWRQQDRPAALAWARTFPSNALRERALQELEFTFPASGR